MSIFDLSPEEFTALSVLVGFALLPGLSANQQNALGNFLMAIGQVLETAAAQSAVTATAAPTPDEATQTRLARLEERLRSLEKQLPNNFN